MAKAQYGLVEGPNAHSNRTLVLRAKRDIVSHHRANTHFDPVKELREQIVALIKEEPADDKQLMSLIDFIRSPSTPDSVIQDLHGSLMSKIKMANKLKWEAKLEEYLEHGPPKYETHKDEYANPPDFLKKVWGDYIDNEVLYQDRLSKYDDKIIPAVYRYWQLHGRDSDDKLPPPRQKRTEAILQQINNGPWSAEEVRRAMRALDRREQRSRDK